jgi:hypothetical protein
VGTHFTSCYKCSCFPAAFATHFPSCYKCSWEIGPDNWIRSRTHDRRGFCGNGHSCICSTMENTFPQKPRRSWVRDRGAHRVGLDQPPAVSRAHGQCRQSQQSHTSQSPRARAQSRTRKAGTLRKPTATHMVFVETHFPWCYKCSWEIGPDNWIQLSGPISRAAGKSGRITGSSYPAPFPGCICSTMENAFPHHACGSKVRACSRRLQNQPCRVAVARSQIRSISHQWQMQNSGRRDCVLWRCDEASMHRLWIRQRVSRQNQAAGKGRAHGFDSTGATLFRGAERRDITRLRLAYPLRCRGH